MFVTGNKYFVWNKKMKDDLSLPQAGDRTRSPDHEVALTHFTRARRYGRCYTIPDSGGYVRGKYKSF